MIVNEVAIVRGAPGDGRGRGPVLPRHLQPLARDVPAARGGRRPPRRADERRHVRRRTTPSSTCSRATRRASATSPSASGRCARSAPRPARRAPKVGAAAARRRPHPGHGHQPVGPTLIAPAIVLGSSAATLEDLAPGQTAKVDLDDHVQRVQRPALSDAVVGPYDWDGAAAERGQQRKLIRRSIIDQLSFDPKTGISVRPRRRLPTPARPGATTRSCRPSSTARGPPRGPTSCTRSRSPFTIHRPHHVPPATCCAATPLDVSANFFSKDPWNISFGSGACDDGLPAARRSRARSTPERLVIGDGLRRRHRMPARHHPSCSPSRERCDPQADGLRPRPGRAPEIEVLDVRTGHWVQFAHMAAGQRVRARWNAARWTTRLPDRSR